MKNFLAFALICIPFAATIACGKNSDTQNKVPQPQEGPAKPETDQPESLPPQSHTDSQGEEDRLPEPSTKDLTAPPSITGEFKEPNPVPPAELTPISVNPAFVFYIPKSEHERQERLKLYNAAGDLFIKERAVPGELAKGIEAARESGDLELEDKLVKERNSVLAVFSLRFESEVRRLKSTHALPNPTDACRKGLGLAYKFGEFMTTKELYLLNKCHVITNQNADGAPTEWYFADAQFTAISIATGMTDAEFADGDFVAELQLDWADGYLGYLATRTVGD